MPDWGQIKPIPEDKGELNWGQVSYLKPSLNWGVISKPTTLPVSTEDIEQPVSLQDMAKIASITPATDKIEPAYLKPSTQWAVAAATPYAKVIEEPIWRTTSSMFQLVGKLAELTPAPFKYQKKAKEKAVGWLKSMADYYGQPEKYAIVSPQVTRARKTYRASTAQQGTASLILNDLGTASADLAGLIAQFALMKKVAPLTGNTPLAQLGKHLTRIGVHGYLTSPGTIQDKMKASATRIGYNVTPYLANATGATGLSAITTDALLNMFLTSPTYKRAYDEANGVNKEFMVMALPQFVMDVGMAMTTRGLPENQLRAKIKQYQKGRIKSLQMPEGELTNLIENMQEREALTTHGRQLQAQMRRKEGIPLHPIEATREEAGKLYDNVNVKDTKRLVARYIRKTTSKYPRRVIDQKSLEDVGNAIAKDMGITDKVYWKYVPTAGDARVRHETNIITGETSHYVTMPTGPTRYTETSLNRKAKEMLGTTWHGTTFTSMKQTKTFLRWHFNKGQGRIKEMIVHELTHALPDVRAMRTHGKMHPPNYIEFTKRVKEEKIKVFFQTEEKEIFEPAEIQAKAEIDILSKERDARQVVTNAKKTDEGRHEPVVVDVAKPPPKPPTATDQSPGGKPEEGPPTRWQLSEPSAVKRMAERLYQTIDVEARFRALGAHETGFHVKNYFSMCSAQEDYGMSSVRHMTRTTKLTPREYAYVTYAAARGKLLDKVDAKRYPKVAAAVKQANKFFLYFERKLSEAGVIKDPWPQSYINRLNDDVAHDRQSIKNIANSDMPQGLKEHCIAKLQEGINEANESIRFLRAENIQYVHIPTRLWLSKLMEEDPVRARRVMSRFFKTRQTVDIQQLAEYLKSEGIITDKDIDVRNIMAAYVQKAGHHLALSNIINAATRDGLISDTKKDWPRYTPRYAPELSGKHIHPAFEAFLDDFTRVSANAPLGRVLSYFKITQFDNPLLLPMYDINQHVWLRGLDTLRLDKSFKFAWRAANSMARKDEAYMRLMENGLASQPYTPPFDQFMRNIEMAKASDSFLNYTLAYLKSNYKIPTDLLYKPLWHTAWGGDRFVRLMSAHYLLDKNHTYRDSAQIAAKYHSDYASVPPHLRRVLNKIFFTPIFPITMGKLQGEMVYRTGKVIADAARLKKPQARDKAMAGGLLALAGLVVLQDNIMTGLGYERDTIGYRYTKKVVDEEGNEKELVVSTPTPANVLLRYARTFDNWPTTPEEWGRYTTRLAWRLQPVWRTAVRLLANIRDDGKTPIYDPFGDPSKIASDMTKFSAGQLIHIINRIDELPGSKADKRAAMEALRDDIGDYYTAFIKTTGQVYLRQTKDKRKRGKMIGLMKSFSWFASRVEKSDEEMGRAMSRFERELRALTETE